MCAKTHDSTKQRKKERKREARLAPTYDSKNNNKGNFVIRMGICREVSCHRSLAAFDVKLPQFRSHSNIARKNVFFSFFSNSFL